MHVHDGIMKLIFGLVLFGSLAAIVAGADSVFPFSNYPMYSKVFVPDSVMIQHSVVVETHDGQAKPLSAGEELRPFWGASFREALFVENDPARIREKFEAAFEWLNTRRVANGELPYKRMRLYRHEIPWDEFVRRRLGKEEVRSLYRRHSLLRLEVAGDK